MKKTNKNIQLPVAAAAFALALGASAGYNPIDAYADDNFDEMLAVEQSATDIDTTFDITSSEQNAIPSDVVDTDFDFSPIEPTFSAEPAAMRFDRVDFGDAQKYADDVYENLRKLSSFDGEAPNSFHSDKLYTVDEDNLSGVSLNESSVIGDIYKTEDKNGILVGKYLVGDTTSFAWSDRFGMKSNVAIAIAECVAACVVPDFPELTFDVDLVGWIFSTVVLRESATDGIIGLVATTYNSNYGICSSVRKEEWKSESDIRAAHEIIEKNVASLVEQSSKFDNDYEKVSLFNDWLIDNNTYSADVRAPHAHSVSSALAGIGDPVCQAYAEAFFVLCKRAGIPCATIVGNANGRHEWNIVEIDGQWYLVDVTWNDGNYEFSGVELARKNYFLIGSDMDRNTHFSENDTWGVGWTSENNHYTIRVWFDNHPLLAKDTYMYFTNYEFSSFVPDSEVVYMTSEPAVTAKVSSHTSSFDAADATVENLGCAYEVCEVAQDGTAEFVSLSEEPRKDWNASNMLGLVGLLAGISSVGSVVNRRRKEKDAA